MRLFHDKTLNKTLSKINKIKTYKIKIIFAVASSLLLLFFMYTEWRVTYCDVAIPSGEFEGKQILLLNSYHPSLKWSEDLSNGVMQTITSNYPKDVKFYVEYMDWKEFPSEEMVSRFNELMQLKYAKRQLDLVIVSDDAALSYAVTHREELFSDVPIVFTGVNDGSYHELVKERINMTGVFETVEIEDTIKIAKMVNPDVENMYIIYDQTESGKAMGKAIEEAVEDHYPEINTIMVTDMSIQAIENYVAKIHSKDAIMTTAYYEDVIGQTIDFEDMIEKICRATNAPVYSIYDFAIGHGAIGGNMLSPALMGERVADISVRILRGELADQIPISDSQTHIKAVDYHEAVAYGIDVSKLPKDVKIVNRPLSFFEQYKKMLILVLSIISALTVFIIVISFYLRKTIQLKNELARVNFDQRGLYDELAASDEQLRAQYESLSTMYDELQESKDKNELLLDAIRDLIIDWNLKDNVYSVSDRWLTTIDAVNSSLSLVDYVSRYIYDEDIEPFKNYLERIKTQSIHDKTNEFYEYLTQIRLFTANSGYRWFLLKSVMKHDIKNEPIRMIISLTDIDELKKMEDQIRYAAFHDELTGFENKNALESRVVRDMRKGALSYSILLIDIDNFKRINDTMGHRFGDKYIQKVGQILENTLFEQSRIYRNSGDEFIIYMNGTGQEAIEQANALLQASNMPVLVEMSKFSNSISIGIAEYPKDGDHLDSVLSKADLAMYQAKDNGRGKVERYEMKLSEHIIWRTEMEEALKSALPNGELYLVYQPQVDTLSREIVGFEALIRWQHPELGFISPAKFIPLAEESHLIMPMGAWIIDRACEFIAGLNSHFDRKYHMSINVSVLQLIQQDFETILDAAFEKYHIDKSLFVLEITESVLIQAFDVASATLDRLQKKGIQIALDDFGTGYSSLSYLRSLPINILKIDKSFIDHVGTDCQQDEIVSLIVQMGRQLNMSLVAEGVETETQHQFLMKTECNFIQGYYFHKPLSEEDCYSAIENENKK